MGRHSYFIGEDDYANSWFSESLRKHEIEGQKTVPIEDILQYYAFSSFNKGDFLFFFPFNLYINHFRDV